MTGAAIVLAMAAAAAQAASQGQASRVREPIQPLPPAPRSDAAATLGAMLFADRRLSPKGDRACVSCHRPQAFGAGPDRFDRGADGKLLPVNTPSVYNAALNFRLNWSGSARDLQSQARASLLNPRIMATTPEAAARRVRADRGLNARARKAFGRDLDGEVLVEALAAYQRTLITPNARFDFWLMGKSDALTAQEERGYGLFKSAGCTACHQGRNVGGNLMQVSGVFHPVTRGERERLRVPSLRNVARTAPYFHDGSAATLEQAVRTMGRAQLNRSFNDRQVADIAAFLRTLSGDAPRRPGP
ncbi:cytochrome c peroxidase [Caulobacter segnis]|uniref:cytochrome-c peroxidase n=1 Tax=Caulobacter segnis TaxID=88688 RepID=UPI00240EC902|nr:cytochrome c peroxidase [Caulobacter segnis]MDG2520454.1 cytochrome c peroxidase [Caulobacter segnis]